MRFTPFKQQKEFLLSNARIKCLFAAKRSGKSEAMYIEAIMKAQNQPNYSDNGIDPYKIAVIAPTENMLSRLLFPKLRAFAKPFESSFLKQEKVLHWNNNNTVIMGFSGEKIERMEGQKIHHVLIDECFQLKHRVFLESIARVSDTEGTITIGGSLGTSINNPKNHWAHQTFKAKHFDGSEIWEWSTADNPHFPKAELARLKDTLDPRTYRQLFEIDWSVPGTSLVYDDFEEANLVKAYKYNKMLPTYCVIDWGFAHPMACLYIQYDPRNDTVYCFDEIVSSRMKLPTLYDRMKAKPYKIDQYYCDASGDQERETSALSNIDWFKKKGIMFKYRRTRIQYGITIVRGYIKDGKGKRKLIVDEIRCPKLLDSILNYSYPEKDGIIQNENPIKKDDDPVDALRYFFVNKLDKRISESSFGTMDRWSKWH